MPDPTGSPAGKRAEGGLEACWRPPGGCSGGSVGARWGVLWVCPLPPPPSPLRRPPNPRPAAQAPPSPPAGRGSYFSLRLPFRLLSFLGSFLCLCSRVPDSGTRLLTLTLAPRFRCECTGPLGSLAVLMLRFLVSPTLVPVL